MTISIPTELTLQDIETLLIKAIFQKSQTLPLSDIEHLEENLDFAARQVQSTLTFFGLCGSPELEQCRQHCAELLPRIRAIAEQVAHYWGGGVPGCSGDVCHVVVRRRGGDTEAIPIGIYHAEMAQRSLSTDTADTDGDWVSFRSVSSKDEGISDPGHAIWWAALDAQDEIWDFVSSEYAEWIEENEGVVEGESVVDTMIRFHELMLYLHRESPFTGHYFKRQADNTEFSDDWDYLESPNGQTYKDSGDGQTPSGQLPLL